MNNLAFFGIVALSTIRFFGFLISLDLYMNLRNKHSFLLISGWLCWSLAGIFPVFADFTEEVVLSDITLIFNNIFIILGAFLILIGIISISREFKAKHLGGFISLIVIFPLLLYLGGGVGLISIFFSLILMIAYLCIIFVNKLAGEHFSQKVGNSYKWILVLRVIVNFQILVIFYIVLSGGSYGLYDSSDVILLILNYGMGITLTLVILIVIIHVENSAITYQKSFLKDTRTHDIGNILQIINSATEMFSDSENSKKKTDLILKKCNETSQIINEIKDL